MRNLIVLAVIVSGAIAVSAQQRGNAQRAGSDG